MASPTGTARRANPPRRGGGTVAAVAFQRPCRGEFIFPRSVADATGFISIVPPGQRAHHALPTFNPERPLFSTKGATTSQPRAAPWESVKKRASPERATQKERTLLSRPFRARSLWMPFPGRCPGLAWVRPLVSIRGVRVNPLAPRSDCPRRTAAWANGWPANGGEGVAGEAIELRK